MLYPAELRAHKTEFEKFGEFAEFEGFEGFEGFDEFDEFDEFDKSNPNPGTLEPWNRGTLQYCRTAPTFSFLSLSRPLRPTSSIRN